MKDPLFLDTGFIVALETSSDQNHDAAAEYWKTFLSSVAPLITTTFILDEIATFFNSRHRHDRAVEAVERLIESDSVELINVDEDLFQTAWDYFKTHADKSFSLTDCISFVVMNDRGIREALTFDRHFAQVGFIKIPGSKL